MMNHDEPLIFGCEKVMKLIMINPTGGFLGVPSPSGKKVSIHLRLPRSCSARHPTQDLLLPRIDAEVLVKFCAAFGAGDSHGDNMAIITGWCPPVMFVGL